MTKTKTFTLIAALLSFSPCASAGPKVLKMATLAPERSPWGQVFRSWAKAISHKSAGAVEMEWLWNGASGGETTAIGKVKTGQLSGAAVTATGLATVYKPISTLQLPGLFSSWQDLDAVRETLNPEIRAAFAERGFYFGGWGDTGIARVLSRGFAVRVPTDLRGHSPGYARESDIAPKLFETIGGITPHPGSAGEVLGALMSGSVDVLVASPLAAEQLQWVSRLTNVNSLTVGYGVGGIVLGEQALAALAPDERGAVESTSQLAARALTERIRVQDDESYERLQKRLTVHVASDADAAAWQGVFKETCRKVRRALGGDALSKLKPC